MPHCRGVVCFDTKGANGACGCTCDPCLAMRASAAIPETIVMPETDPFSASPDKAKRVATGYSHRASAREIEWAQKQKSRIAQPKAPDVFELPTSTAKTIGIACAIASGCVWLWISCYVPNAPHAKARETDSTIAAPVKPSPFANWQDPKALLEADSIPAHSEDPEPPARSKAQAEEPGQAPPPETFRKLIAIWIPLMRDTTDDDEDNRGADGLAVTMSERLPVWNEITALPEETSAKAAANDPARSRGKRICASGKIWHIEVAIDSPRMTNGNLSGADGVNVEFLAVGSAGNLAAPDWARFCGVFVGTDSFTNESGGITRAVRAVGVFDLPANHGAPKSMKPGVSGGRCHACEPGHCPSPLDVPGCTW